MRKKANYNLKGSIFLNYNFIVHKKGTLRNKCSFLFKK